MTPARRFVDFVVPATVGGVASGAAAYLTRRAMPDASKRKLEVASVLASSMAFWVFAGITWLVWTRVDER